VDQQVRELLSEEIGQHIGWYIREQTKHLVEAMPCNCDETHVQDGVIMYVSKGEHCERCNKLEELEKLV